MHQRLLPLILTLFGLTVSVGCHENSNSNSVGNNQSACLTLVATTGQINSALERITDGTSASVKLFCGPGVDPHSYNASLQDVQAMLDADLIIYNGFHLEAKLDEFLHGKFGSKSWAMASAFPKASRLKWEEDEAPGAATAPFDPHIWNHLPAWSACVKALAKRLADADPENRDIYLKNGDNYASEILETHTWAMEKLATLPPKNKTLVSAHDAFNYFAKEYSMEPLAVLGIGNDPEADIKTMQKVATEICDKKIPAIFMESISNPKVSQALQEACAARNWKVKLITRPLYSDDLGADPPLNTFLGAFRSNVEIIYDSLK